jgi:hypothetical protein
VNDAEKCTLAIQKFPTGFTSANPHAVVVSAIGDVFTATVTWSGGTAVVSIPSLTAANAKVAACGGAPLPQGTDFGFRTWTAGTTTFVGRTMK